MFRTSKNTTLIFLTLFTFLHSYHALAAGNLVKDKIENFQILGISLNTSLKELDSLLAEHHLQFACSIEQGGFKFQQKSYVESYQTCKAKKANINLTITHSDARISQIILNMQSSRNFHNEILDNLKTLKKELLALGEELRQNYPSDREKGAFYYKSNEIGPGMSDINMILKTSATCIEQTDTVVSLAGKFMMMPGLNDVNISTSNGRSHLC